MLITDLHWQRDNDFSEGVRALLVEKDNSPKWKPSTLEEVDDATVSSYFEPIDNELEL